MDLIAKACDYFLQGGPVMVPIVLDSLWMWAVIAERIFYFRRISRGDIDLKMAVEMLKGRQTEYSTDALRARIVARFVQEQTGDGELDQKLLDQYAMEERPVLKRNLALIAVLAAVAPLLGLLGTVTGMMNTFNVIAVFGTGNARGMASGISEALITTQCGLLVAIPGLFMSAFLSRRADRIENGLNEFLMTLKRII
ncbi:MAG TPA: MotA/TolQ/ExbB proton channel family protein [Desulfobacteraceae bacterium]|nr:MotA/TolQ/ExbB proton channel family protein [Desulfobacteraceae bacterium]